MKSIIKKRITRALVMVLVLVAIAAGYYYGYYMPERQDGAYNAKLANITGALKDESGHLADTDSLPIFYDINESPVVCAENASKVIETVKRLEVQLNNLESIAGSSQSMYIYGFSPGATKTKARAIRAEAMVKQSRQAVARYVELTTFLQSLAEIRKEYVGVISPLTTTVDLNNFLYRTYELRADADVIDTLAGRVAQVVAPLGFDPVRDQVVAQYKETAAGYRDLASGLELFNDASVDVAAHRIESAVAALDSSVQSQYTAILGQATVLKDIGDLSDKFIIE